MGCCASNNDEEFNKKMTDKQINKSKTTQEEIEIMKKPTIVMKEIKDELKPFLFDRHNSKLLERLYIIERVVRDTEGFGPQFLILKESESDDAFEDNLNTLWDEFKEILTIANFTKEEFAEMARYLIAEHYIVNKGIAGYQQWNIPGLILTYYRDYIGINKKRFNKNNETNNLEAILKSFKNIFPYKQAGPVYEPVKIPRNLPFNLSDINNNFNLNCKFNEMRCANFILEKKFFVDKEFMDGLCEIIKNAQNMLSVSLILYFENDDVDGVIDDIFDKVSMLMDCIAANENIVAFFLCNANKIVYDFSDEFIDKLCLIISKKNLIAFHVSGISVDEKMIESLEHSKPALLGINANNEDNDIFVDKLIKVLNKNQNLQGFYLAGFNLTLKQLEVIKKMLFDANKNFKGFEYLSNSAI